MQSLAAAPYATDWDHDGDFDMLIGNISGQVILLENIGDQSKPEFSTKRTLLTAGGKEIQVAHGDSGPVHEDWDQDGRRDLVVGAGDGSVVWYRNEGSEREPAFASGRMLIQPCPDDSYPFQTNPVRSGLRVKICVSDFNGDGLVDLLVGDFITEKSPEEELSEPELARREELQLLMEEYGMKVSTAYADFQAQIKELNEDSEAYKAAEAQYKKTTESLEMDKIFSEYKDFAKTGTFHGFVWLFLRQADGRGDPRFAGSTVIRSRMSNVARLPDAFASKNGPKIAGLGSRSLVLEIKVK